VVGGQDGRADIRSADVCSAARSADAWRSGVRSGQVVFLELFSGESISSPKKQKGHHPDWVMASG